MKPLAVAGSPDADTGTVVDRLIEALAERGPVATVDRRSSESATEPRGETATSTKTQWELGDEGWLARGDERTVGTIEDVFERLAPEHDYAVVEGGGDLDVPTVVVGDAAATGPVVASVSEPSDLETVAVVETVESSEPFETLESLVAKAKESDGEQYAGAIATFTGRVRAQEDPDDPPTEFLEFERYDEVAHQQFAEIRQDILDRDGIYEVLLHHRTGVVEAGVDIVFVVILAGHRGEAFEAVQDGINRLKAEVPLFKKEVTVDEQFWRHERPVEHDD